MFRQASGLRLTDNDQVSVERIDDDIAVALSLTDGTELGPYVISCCHACELMAHSKDRAFFSAATAIEHLTNCFRTPDECIARKSVEVFGHNVEADQVSRVP